MMSYAFLKECATYVDAVQVLENLQYVKTPSEISARHLLATARQTQEQSLNDFVERLQVSGKIATYILPEL